ncbi:MAG TPA: (2Fe-2S)-binding protein [Niallia sp.]|nr:(2Fe-2S)-binding protein [Niallia sp.]
MIYETPNLVQVTVKINGEIQQIIVPPSKTLLASLREDLFLTGSKPGCFNGDCGACTVIIDELPMKSCLMLAAEVEGKEITTIEGLSDSPVQRAFIENFAFQCGYCTPGFIMNIQAMLNSVKNPSPDTIKEWLESNICRCTSYEEIEQAVQEVIDKYPSKY